MTRFLVPLAVLLPFGLFSSFLVFSDGYFGFVGLALRERWALQLLLDVGISVSLVSIWMVRDARERRITVWPYLVAAAALGSIGPLAYLVHRGVKQWRASRANASPVPAY